MRRFILWLLGLHECVECGVVARRWGKPILLSGPHDDSERYGYLCERCSNEGLLYQDMKRAEWFENTHPDSQFSWGGELVKRHVKEPQ